MKKLSLFTFLLFLTLGYAQVKTPQPSPSSKVIQTVGLSEITVDYSRPSAKDRKVFGELVPFGELWRTGANGSTDITFSTDVVFGGSPVEAGKYALYTIPNSDEWEVILYKDTEQWGAPKSLDKDQVVVKCLEKVQSTTPYVESFTIGFDDLRNETANLVITWEDTMIEVPISVDSKTAVLESIKKTMSDSEITADDYHAAASFYLDNKMELDKALEWSKAAEKLNPKAFWMIKVQSEIYAAQGDYKNAITTAERSLKLAEAAKYDAYINMNKENIAKWSEM